jgi:hypothetical protein
VFVSTEEITTVRGRQPRNSSGSLTPCSTRDLSGTEGIKSKQARDGNAGLATNCIPDSGYQGNRGCEAIGPALGQ